MDLNLSQDTLKRMEYPVCYPLYDFEDLRDKSPRQTVECKICGSFDIEPAGIRVLDFDPVSGEDKRPAVRHAIARMQAGGRKPLITREILKSLFETARLPGVPEQMDNLLVWMAEQSRISLTQGVEIPGISKGIARDRLRRIAGIIGTCDDPESVHFLVVDLCKRNLIAWDKLEYATVEVDGWQRYEEIMKAKTEGSRAFMAMPFGCADVDEAFEHFRRAVKDTGFDLQRVDTKPEAGPIDSRIRTEIRRSQFVICDCTRDNSGAYFEAGFAEGLGRPVIYTVNEKWLKKDKDKNRLHFDTRQSTTIFWKRDRLDKAAEELKELIGNTLRKKAIMEDPKQQA